MATLCEKLTGRCGARLTRMKRLAESEGRWRQLWQGLWPTPAVESGSLFFKSSAASAYLAISGNPRVSLFSFALLTCKIAVLWGLQNTMSIHLEPLLVPERCKPSINWITHVKHLVGTAGSQRGRFLLWTLLSPQKFQTLLSMLTLLSKWLCPHFIEKKEVPT